MRRRCFYRESGPCKGLKKAVLALFPSNRAGKLYIAKMELFTDNVLNGVEKGISRQLLAKLPSCELSSFGDELSSLNLVLVCILEYKLVFWKIIEKRT
jgi:hypothetical protein